MVSDTFLHNLSVNLALDAEEQLRLAEITPSEDVINHLSNAFNESLKHVAKARMELPVFKGYTVDERLREFRKMDYGVLPEFIPFDSPKGQELLSEMEATVSSGDLK